MHDLTMPSRSARNYAISQDNSHLEKILLVEDDDILRETARLALEESGYRVVSVANGQDALDVLDDLDPELILSDISMPKMDGFALLDAVRARREGATLPFLFITVHTDRESVTQARRLGVDDYLSKPFQLDELLEAVRIRLDRRHTALVLDTREAHIQTVRMLANVIEARDSHTGGHVDRVCRYALTLGRALGWSDERLVELEFGAFLHDIGKITIPKRILNKKGALTQGEKRLLRQHVLEGANMLSDICHLRNVIPYVLYHHEKWDGSGYPHGLAGKEIPIEGRLLAIVDVYDAMTSDRPYHTALPKETALDNMLQKRGIHFDPDLIDIFCQMQEV